MFISEIPSNTFFYLDLGNYDLYHIISTPDLKRELKQTSEG